MRSKAGAHHDLMLIARCLALITLGSVARAEDAYRTRPQTRDRDTAQRCTAVCIETDAVHVCHILNMYERLATAMHSVSAFLVVLQ